VSAKKRLLKSDRIPIQAIDRAPTPFFHLNIDLVGPIAPKSSRGHEFILCLVDNYSRWAECVPLKGLTAKETVDALISVFCRIGVPSILQNDNGKNLISGLNKELYTRLGIELRCSTPLYPQSNGLVERFNCTLKKSLNNIVNSTEPRSWDVKLPFLLWSYRTAVHETTGLSPYQLVYGRTARGPLSILQDSCAKTDEYYEWKNMTK